MTSASSLSEKPERRVGKSHRKDGPWVGKRHCWREMPAYEREKSVGLGSKYVTSQNTKRVGICHHQFCVQVGRCHLLRRRAGSENVTFEA